MKRAPEPVDVLRGTGEPTAVGVGPFLASIALVRGDTPVTGLFTHGQFTQIGPPKVR